MMRLRLNHGGADVVVEGAQGETAAPGTELQAGFAFWYFQMIESLIVAGRRPSVLFAV